MHYGVHNQLRTGAMGGSSRTDERQIPFGDRLQPAQTHLFMPVDPALVPFEMPRGSRKVPTERDDQHLTCCYGDPSATT
jgi:hypothetical protein